MKLPRFIVVGSAHISSVYIAKRNDSGVPNGVQYVLWEKVKLREIEKRMDELKQGYKDVENVGI